MNWHNHLVRDLVDPGEVGVWGWPAESSVVDQVTWRLKIDPGREWDRGGWGSGISLPVGLRGEGVHGLTGGLEMVVGDGI